MKFSLKMLFSCTLFLLLGVATKAQTSMTTEKWQEDINYLEKTIHNEFPFLFKKITKEAWDAKVAQFRTEVPNLESHEIEIGITRLISAFEYGHTQVWFGNLVKNVLPVNLYHFEDGVYVEGVQKGSEKALGARVVAVNNVKLEEALVKIRPVVPAENDQYFKAYGLRFLTAPSILHAQGILPTYSKSVTLQLEKDGVLFEQSFEEIPLKEMSRDYGFTIPNEQWISVRNQEHTPLYLKHLHEKLYFFEYLEDSKTVYVRQSSVFNDDKETLADFYERLFSFIDSNAVDKLIYDVRLNGGGNNYNNKPFIKGIMARPSINQTGKFFYVIGRNTFSAAQNLTNEITNYTEAIIVGEPTAENLNFYGDARRVQLPNSGMQANLSYAWWQDVPAWENKEYTIPHLASEMTFNDYRNNEDPVVSMAINYTNDGDFILHPAQHLTQLFSQGNMEQLMKDGTRIAKDPRYKYSNFEEDFSKTAYRIFSSGDQEMGISIYGFVVHMYPESSGAWYSYASALEQAKQTAKAKEAYQKIIDLNNTPTLVSSAKQKIAQLK